MAKKRKIATVGYSSVFLPSLSAVQSLLGLDRSFYQMAQLASELSGESLPFSKRTFYNLTDDGIGKSSWRKLMAFYKKLPMKVTLSQYRFLTKGVNARSSAASWVTFLPQVRDGWSEEYQFIVPFIERRSSADIEFMEAFDAMVDGRDKEAISFTEYFDVQWPFWKKHSLIDHKLMRDMSNAVIGHTDDPTPVPERELLAYEIQARMMVDFYFWLLAYYEIGLCDWYLSYGHTVSFESRLLKTFQIHAEGDGKQTLFGDVLEDLLGSVSSHLNFNTEDSWREFSSYIPIEHGDKFFANGGDTGDAAYNLMGKWRAGDKDNIPSYGKLMSFAKNLIPDDGGNQRVIADRCMIGLALNRLYDQLLAFTGSTEVSHEDARDVLKRVLLDYEKYWNVVVDEYKRRKISLEEF